MTARTPSPTELRILWACVDDAGTLHGVPRFVWDALEMRGWLTPDGRRRITPDGVRALGQTPDPAWEAAYRWAHYVAQTTRAGLTPPEYPMGAAEGAEREVWRARVRPALLAVRARLAALG
jgi:hypothetical protein